MYIDNVLLYMSLCNIPFLTSCDIQICSKFYMDEAKVMSNMRYTSYLHSSQCYKLWKKIAQFQSKLGLFILFCTEIIITCLENFMGGEISKHIKSNLKPGRLHEIGPLCVIPRCQR